MLIRFIALLSAVVKNIIHKILRTGTDALLTPSRPNWTWPDLCAEPKHPLQLTKQSVVKSLNRGRPLPHKCGVPANAPNAPTLQRSCRAKAKRRRVFVFPAFLWLFQVPIPVHPCPSVVKTLSFRPPPGTE